MAVLKYSVLLALSILTCAGQLTHHGVYVSVENIPYYIPPTAHDTLNITTNLLKHWTSIGDLIPITVVDVSSTSCEEDSLVSKLESFLDRDDVLNTGFLEAMIIQPVNGARPSTTCLSPDKKKQYGIKLELINTGSRLPFGPYFLSKSTLSVYIPYRLYSDTQQAFTAGVIPDSNCSFSHLPASIPGVSTMTIGVPSRLYYKPTPDRPLAGVRLGIKDIYDIKGLKTGAGSRAYYTIYPTANTTALVVQQLINAGAVIVGKMKTSQFAQPEFASNAIDYQAPFNARGDGYQEPASSSSGPAAGMGAYEWLDIALGSDTGGSIRYPATMHGLYGNRPSHGLVDMSDVVSLAAEFDTPGFLVRDPGLWRTAVGVLDLDISNYTKYPNTIQKFGIKNATASDATTADIMIASFIDKVAEYLDANVTSLNYTAKWEETRPAKITDDLSTYLNNTWSLICAKEQATLLRDPLLEKYANAYNARKPYINPVAREYWTWGDSFSDTNLADAKHRKDVFSDWWSTTINQHSDLSCAKSLIIPVSVATGLMNGLFIAPLAGVVDVVVPIGQLPYESTVTGHEEVLPVSVNIMAPHGCDGMVLDLVNELVGVGILGSVEVGNSVFGGQIFV